MKQSRIPIFIALVLVFLFASFSDAAVRVRKLGDPQTAFYSPDIRTEADLREMLRVRRDDIRDILAQVNWRGNVEDLYNALDHGTFAETTISSQTRLPFMAARKRGRPKAMLDVLYEGLPFDAYYVDFESGGSGWRFIAPKICSNFWIEERAIEKPAPPPPPPPPPAPPAPEPEAAPPPPAPEAPPEIQPERVPLFFGAGFIGKERSEDFLEDSEIFLGHSCKTIVGVKGGILPRLSDNVEAEISIGGKFVIDDDDQFDDNEDDDLLPNNDGIERDKDADKTLFIDAAVHALFNHGFVGGGVSFWDLNSSERRTIALLLQVGFGPPKVQFAFEARAPFEHLDDLENNYMFWGGIRIHP